MNVLKKNFFNFTYPHNKLLQLKFTTIRAKNAIQFYDTHDIVNILIQGSKKFEAEIVKIDQKTLGELDLDFLKKDAAYPGFQLQSKAQFLALLNSFRKYSKIKETELLTIFYLRKT